MCGVSYWVKIHRFFVFRVYEVLHRFRCFVFVVYDCLICMYVRDAACLLSLCSVLFCDFNLQIRFLAYSACLLF